MPKTDPPSFHVRLTPALQKRLKISAVESERSMNAEIVARLELSFEIPGAERNRAVKLLSEALTLLKGG